MEYRVECLEKWTKTINEIVEKFNIDNNITEWTNFNDIYNILSILVSKTNLYISCKNGGWLQGKYIAKKDSFFIKLDSDTIKPSKLILYKKNTIDEYSYFELVTDKVKPLLDSNIGKKNEEVYIFENCEIQNYSDVDSGDYSIYNIKDTRIISLEKTVYKFVSMKSIYEQNDGKTLPKSFFES